ncbi:mycothiol synthase [Jatrophihabitans sp. GAS493]|uniref:mycothiol synthase n=1 Tax=Jatrophihabitans sp. GAS493 TaxID=1907575 RepID=UPI0012FD7AF1|nr:mycothiol synthase [Jatrophihabitans sp. GAS493]
MIHVQRRPGLDEQLRHSVEKLAAAVERRDGAPPLSDDALMHLGDPERVHLISTDGSASLTGYAQLSSSAQLNSSTQLSSSAQLNGAAAEVLGDRATVDALLGEVESLAPKLTVWSHGTLSPVAPAAGERGYRTTRILWQLRSPNAEPGPSGRVEVPAGVVIRPFVLGQDEEALLAINRAAFAELPDQGGWTLDDLADRFGASWFDVNGLLVAEQAATAELLGFHWTKVHPDDVGEVYVLAVAPAAQGMQLGRVLLQAGLDHLRQRGTDGVLLYVDDSNRNALHLYERNGFSRYNQDVQLQKD